MSTRTKWIGVTVVMLGLAIGAQHVRAAVSHHGSNGMAATTISPNEITRAAGVLPVTVIDSYF